MMAIGMWLRAFARWKQRMVTSPCTTRSTSNAHTSSSLVYSLRPIGRSQPWKRARGSETGGAP
jgi:hypothetical protein